jgi:hypothetical protein
VSVCTYVLFSINLFVSTYALIPINLFVSTYALIPINFFVSIYVLISGSHIEYPTGTKNSNFVGDHPRNIPAKFGSNRPSGFGEEA